MSRISENIRKITRAWGGKTTGNGISDALLDLYNNLPFSVKKPLDYKFMPEGYPKVEMKTVEIVPEQSVTGQYMPAEDGYPAGYSLNMPMDIGLLKVGGKYTVVFNGKTYNVEATSGGSEAVRLPLDGIHDIMYYEASNEPVEWVMSMMWEEDHGETITLAIYEKQEVVTPLDPKFVGGGGVIIYADTMNLFKDEECTEVLTKEELKAIIGKAIIYADFLNDGRKMQYHMPLNYDFNNDYGAVQVYEKDDYSDFPQARTLYTAEYVSAEG